MSDSADTQATIALVGHPNVGKTTIFNALTGANQRVGNFSGVTVDLKEGFARTPHGAKLRVLDLPGCYGLRDSSADEQVTVDFLQGREDSAKPNVVVCVVDGSALERQLPLVLEIIEQGYGVVIALNLIDAAEKSGIRLDPTKLSEELGVPVVPMQADRGKGLVALKQALRFPLPHEAEATWADADDPAKARREKVAEVCAVAARRSDEHQQTVSDRIDRILLHPVYGWVIFSAILLMVFWSIFKFAEHPMGWIEGIFESLGGAVSGMMAEGDLNSLLVDGVIGGVAGVLVFLPQILILFFFIGLLESTGYMARAAYLMDGVMSKVGLSGKAFLPLLSSYACAIPGVMATRTIPSAKEKLVTIFVAPWMSCTARLPVYALVIGLLMPAGTGSWQSALILFGIYALGTATAFIVARILRGRLGDDEQPQHFLLELPNYRRPQWSYIFRHVLDRGFAFVKKAGTLILGLSILLWALSTYPKPVEGSDETDLEASAMGHIGQFIEPVVKPLGWDGRIGTAVLTSFAAREVFNSSLAIIYSVDDELEEDEFEGQLRDQLAAATWPDGSKIFTPLTLLSVLVFFIYALQCLPTSAVVQRETGSWKWAIGQFVFMTAFAYVAALLVYQIGRIIS